MRGEIALLREYYRMIIYVAFVVEILVYILEKITKDEKTGDALKKAFKIIRIVMIVFIGIMTLIK